MRTNIILATDSYKLGHWRQYPADTTGVYSYFEARPGARFPYTVFFGLQSILKRYMVGSVVEWDDVSEALALSRAHFADGNMFNYAGWSRVMSEHGGRLPLRIKAVREGTVVPVGNVLMTVENTDPELPWLTNAMESLLTHVWYPTTVATLSHFTKGVIRGYLEETGVHAEGLPFMLHDFGYRGASSHETAEIGGAAHLVNFVGTDTLPGMLLACRDYSADVSQLAFSVPATEHSIMTAEGADGEFDVVDHLLEQHPDGILSVVADSYDIYRFVRTVGRQFKDRILGRDGVFVIRPDSVTARDATPASLMVSLLEIAYHEFGGTANAKGYRLLDPHVRFLWGDGIDVGGIDNILRALENNSFAAENMATFGMGGGLLQKVDRDTQRFAFKMAAIRRGDGEWVPTHKTTSGKESKAGRMKLVRLGDPDHGPFATWEEEREGVGYTDDLLETVFENGELVREQTFEEIRMLAAGAVPVAS